MTILKLDPLDRPLRGHKQIAEFTETKARPRKIAVRPPQPVTVAPKDITVPVGAGAIATSLAGLTDAWRRRQAQVSR
jgi:hypothetical protein